MANGSTITVTLRAIADISDVLANAKQIEKAFDQLVPHIGKDLGGQIKSAFKDIGTEIEKIQQKTSKGVLDKKDIREVEKSYNNVTRLLQQVQTLGGKITQQDLTKAFTFDSAKVKELTAQITEIQAKLSNFKTQGFSGFKELESAITTLRGLTSNKKLEAFDFEGVLQSFQKGDFSKLQQAIQLIDELQSKVKKVDDQPVTELGKQYQVVYQHLTQLKSAAESGDLSNLIQQLNQVNNELDSVTSKGVEELVNSLSTVIDQTGTVSEQNSRLGQSFSEASREALRFNENLENMGHKIKYFFGIENALNLVKRAIRSAYQSVTELDKAMTETAVVTDFTVGDMWEKLPEYTKMANKLGATTQGAYETSTLYYQQGLNTAQVMAISTETMKMARIAGMEYADATNMMTAALRGFNMAINEQSATRVNDVYSELAAITAADTNQIATAMTKTASIAASANMEFENTAAFLSQIIETTQEAPETAGTALKTIIARFTEVKKLYSQGDLLGTDEEGEAIDVNKIQTALRSVGISMTEFFRGEEGLDDVLLRLAEKWDTLDLTTQRYIATTAAGSRQQSRFLAMMSDYDRTMELVGAANDSAGASQKQFDKTLESLESKVNKLNNAWQAFTMSLADDGLIKGAVEALTGLLNIINGITDAFGEGSGVVKLLMMGGLFKIGTGIAGGIKQYASDLGQGLPTDKSFGIGMSKAMGYGELGNRNIFQAARDKSLWRGGRKSREVRRQQYEDAGLAAAKINKEDLQNYKKLNELKKEEKALDEEILKLDQESTQAWFNEDSEAFNKAESRKKQLQKEKEEKQEKIKSGESINQDTLDKAAQIKEEAAMKTRIEGYQKVGQAAIVAAGAFALFANMAEKSGNEKLAETFNSAATAVGILGAALTTIPPLLNAIGVSAATVATLMGPITIILGVLAAGFVAFKAIDAYTETTAEKAERLAEEAEKAKETADSAKQAYNDFLNGTDSHNKLLEELESLVEGTEAFKRKLDEANEAARNLIGQYDLVFGEHYYIDDSGAIKFDAEKVEQRKKALDRERLYTDINAEIKKGQNEIAQKDANIYGTEVGKFQREGIYGQKFIELAKNQENLLEFEVIFKELSSKGNISYEQDDRLRELFSLNSTFEVEDLKNSMESLSDFYSGDLSRYIQDLSITKGPSPFNYIIQMAAKEQGIDTSTYGYSIAEEQINSAALEIFSKEDIKGISIDQFIKDSRYDTLEEIAQYAEDVYDIILTPDSYTNPKEMAEALRSAIQYQEFGEELGKINEERLKVLQQDEAQAKKMSLATLSTTKAWLAEYKANSDTAKIFEKIYSQAEESLKFFGRFGFGEEAQNLNVGELLDANELTQTFMDADLGFSASQLVASLFSEDEQQKISSAFYEALQSIPPTTDTFQFARHALDQAARYSGEAAADQLGNALRVELAGKSKEIFSSLYNDSSFSEALDSLNEIYQTQGEITAQDVSSLAKEYDILSDALELSTINAGGLAATLEQLNVGDINFSQITDGLLTANSIANELASTVAEAKRSIEEFDPGESWGEVGQSIGGIASEIFTSLESGAFGDPKWQNQLAFILGNEAVELVKSSLGHLKPGASSKENIEILKNGPAGELLEALALASETGDMFGLWKYELTRGRLSDYKDLGFSVEGETITTDYKTLSEAKAGLIGAGYTEQEANRFLTDFMAQTLFDKDGKSVIDSWQQEAVQNGIDALLEDSAATMEVWEGFYNDNKAFIKTSNGETINTFEDFKKYMIEDEGRKSEGKKGWEVEPISWEGKHSEDPQTRLDAFNKLNKSLEGTDKYVNIVNDDLVTTEEKLKNLGYNSEESFELIKSSLGSDKTLTYLGRDITITPEMDLAEFEQAKNEIEKAELGFNIAQGFTEYLASIEDIEVGATFYALNPDFFNPKTCIAYVTFKASNTIDSISGNARGRAGTGVGEATGQRGFESSRIPGFARGRNNYEGIAWTGEKGPELVNGQHGTYVTGINGPELQYIYKDDAIYTADQTRRIFHDLNIPGFYTGKSYGIDLSGLRDAFISGSGSGGGSKKGGDWDNPYDELYNLTEKINEALRDREKLERQYDRLLKNRNASYIDLIRNTLDSMANLRKEIALQQALQAGRARQLENIGQYTYRDKDKKEKTFAESGVMQYAQYNSATGLLEIDWEGIEAVTDENKGAAIEAYISKLEELVEQYEETEETIADMEDTLEEIRDRGKEQYLEFEDRIYEALVEREQKIIDEYEDASNTINDSNSRILDGLRESIDLSRQIRDNTKTEEDIADKEARLAYLRRDTSGANQLEIQQLEEELKEMRQSYQDSLVDQELDRLNQVNETANEQRERQIEIANAQLEWLEQSGYFWDETYALLKGAFNEDGTLNNNSALVNLLKETDGFKGMSEFGSYDWIVKLIQEFNEAESGYSSWMLDKAEDQGYIEGTSVGKLTYDRESGKWTGEDGKEYTAAWNEKKNSWDVKEVKADTSTKPGFETGKGDNTAGIGGGQVSWKTEWVRDSIGHARRQIKYIDGKKVSESLEPRQLHLFDGLKCIICGYIKKKTAKSGGYDSLKEYATGGLNTRTGPAILDGTPSRPEYVLNAEQTGAFLQLAEVLPALMSNNSVSTSTSSGDNYFDININVDSISSDYDVDRLTERIKQNIYEDGAYRNVNVINRLR